MKELEIVVKLWSLIVMKMLNNGWVLGFGWNDKNRWMMISGDDYDWMIDRDDMFK